MTDVFTKAKRSEIMALIKDRNTSPENIIAKMLRKLKVKHRRNVKSIIGQPDFVILRHKKIIFIHGCFWHRHNCKKGRSMPATRKKFWQSKLTGNVARDRKNLKILKKLGWKILVVWECQIKNSEKLIYRLRMFLES